MDKKLYTYKAVKPCHLECTIDLKKLFQTEVEKKRFDSKLNEFLVSDPDNRKLYKIKNDILTYKSEQLIPSKQDKRPPLLLVLGNPATHSVRAGMFFSFEASGREHRFWKNILKPAGVLNLPYEPGKSINKLNKDRRHKMIQVDYDSPFRIGLSVFITMPSAPGGKWGGVAGVQTLLGKKALQRLETLEVKRIQALVQKFISPDGAVVAFQKNAWNALKSKNDPLYTIHLAKEGKLKGTLKHRPEIPLYCVPPTRISGPCRRVLNKLLLG